MLAKLSYRKLTALIFFSCAGLLGYAYYLQYVEYLDPCPLCLLQRFAFYGIAVFALLGFLHNPKGIGRKFYALFMVLFSALGIAIAGRHVWLQSLPDNEKPACGPGLEYMMDTLPLGEVFDQVLNASGECAQVSWTFMGLSMPWWTIVWYVIFVVLALFTARAIKTL